MLWLYRGRFVNVKLEKLPNLAAPQVRKYIKTNK